MNSTYVNNITMIDNHANGTASMLSSSSSSSSSLSSSSITNNGMDERTYGILTNEVTINNKNIIGDDYSLLINENKLKNDLIKIEQLLKDEKRITSTTATQL